MRGKTTIYAPRISGDLDLGLETSRPRGTVKAWAHIDSPGGRLPGGSKQDIYEQSLTQNYHIGTRRVQDERVFRYCKASTLGCQRTYLGAQSTHIFKNDGTKDYWEGTVSGAQDAGSYTVVILDTNSNHIADFFAGGWFYVRSSSAAMQWYRIRKSTAGGTSVTLTLWDPLVYATANGVACMLVPSIYSSVERVHGGGSPTAATVCMPIIVVTASWYFWGQTWGPCGGTPSEAVPGTGSYERTLVFNYDGSIKLISAPAAGLYHQIAGYLLINPQDNPTAAPVFFMLTISP